MFKFDTVKLHLHRLVLIQEYLEWLKIYENMEKGVGELRMRIEKENENGEIKNQIKKDQPLTFNSSIYCSLIFTR